MCHLGSSDEQNIAHQDQAPCDGSQASMTSELDAERNPITKEPCKLESGGTESSEDPHTKQAFDSLLCEHSDPNHNERNPQDDELEADPFAVHTRFLKEWGMPQARTLSPAKSPPLHQIMKFGAELCSQIESSRSIEDINQAIDYCSSALSLPADCSSYKPSLLSSLGNAHFVRFEHLGELADLNKSIDSVGEAILLAPVDHPSNPIVIDMLGNSYFARFRRLGDLMDLQEAINYRTKAASLSPNTDPAKPEILENLGIAHSIRFKRLGELIDLEKSIEYKLDALTLTPNDDPCRPQMLVNLANSYNDLFERLGDLQSLDNAIKYRVEVASITPNEHPDKPVRLSILGISYWTRFRSLGELPDLNKAIKYKEDAVSVTLDSDSGKPQRLINLGVSYHSRFGCLGHLEDLNKAVKYKSDAVVLASLGHLDTSTMLGTLGVSLWTRFERLGELPDLNNAIECQEEANSLTPSGHPDKPNTLNSLGAAYHSRFEHLGEPGDLDKAIKCKEEAVSLTPDGDPDRAQRLGNLGASYQVRFEHLGKLADLNSAIDYEEEAVSLTPNRPADNSGRFNNLGNAYQSRFWRLGELPDLHKAIEYEEKAASVTPDDHPNKPTILSNLGNSYQSRFERLGELPDLNNAIKYEDAAVFLTPEDHPDKPGRLSNLAQSYWSRSEHLGALADLENAIKYETEAALLTPDKHHFKPRMLGSLGSQYLSRFEHLGEQDNLAKAIEYQSRAVSLIAEGHTEQARLLCNLGNLYQVRFDCSQNTSDMEFAVTCFRKAAQSPNGPPIDRLKACRKWAIFAHYDPASCSHSAYQQAMELLPQLIWIGTTLGRRYDLVKEISDLATEAASYAISTNAHGLALEWLEAGRSIVWGQIAQLRTPFDRLFAHDPSLANKLREVGRKLDHAGARSFLAPASESGSLGFARGAGAHHRLAEDWSRYLNEARSIPGFEDFLRPPKSSQLLGAARSHPIAVINAHQSRCDALIIQPNSDTIAHIPLTEFSFNSVVTARQHVATLGRGRKPGRLNRFGSIDKSLEEVWLGIAKPILNFLGYTRKLPIAELPRLTWCTTGLLSFLPLHAAGCDGEFQPNVFDFVISSYTPTLSTLLSERTPDSGSKRGLVAVGQEHTPGLDHLPGTKDELAAIRSHAPTAGYLQLENTEATIDRVLNAMDEFSWVHMACHGSQDTTDPTQSAFHLYDGSLTLATITKRSFQGKGLAFLSACQTATGDQNMAEEAVHLAAGMLMAGYPSVIGTMWSIEDEDGPLVADKIYAELLKDGTIDHTKSARALHQAIAHLREKVGEKAISRWAPFIHIGA